MGACFESAKRKNLKAFAVTVAIGALLLLPASFSRAEQGAQPANAEEEAEATARKAAAERNARIRSLMIPPVGSSSIHACNHNARGGYTSPQPKDLPPGQGGEKELCVSVPRQVVITKWACEFAKDRQAQFCIGLGKGVCDVIGWVWPSSFRVVSRGNFNDYCLTGHQDSDREWRYFNIHLSP